MEQLGQDGVESNQRRVAIISQDSFYRELCEEEAEDAKVGNFDFDHPGNFFLTFVKQLTCKHSSEAHLYNLQEINLCLVCGVCSLGVVGCLVVVLVEEGHSWGKVLHRSCSTSVPEM